jgi:hypothetical protein
VAQPFSVAINDQAAARVLARVGKGEARIVQFLETDVRPIVLAHRAPGLAEETEMVLSGLIRKRRGWRA